jgi:hypothetical protein
VIDMAGHSKGAGSATVAQAMAMAVSIAAAVWPLDARAQGAAKPLSAHVKKDIERHRAMAAAHEAAARCLEAGKEEDQCQKELQVMCKGLAIGKHCGMRHEH